MAAGPNDLTTVAGVQAFLSLPSGQDADLLQSLVTAASTFIQTALGYNIEQATYTDIRNGHGRESILLLNLPIVSVASVTINGISIPESTGWPAVGYSYDDAKVTLRGYRFERGSGNVTIVYTGGYDAVPADLAQACNELVALKYQMRLKLNLNSEGALQQMTSYVQKDMPSSVQTTINYYRRVFAR